MIKQEKHDREMRKFWEGEQFQQEATSGDYDHLLQTCFKYVDVQ